MIFATYVPENAIQPRDLELYSAEIDLQLPHQLAWSCAKRLRQPE